MAGSSNNCSKSWLKATRFRYSHTKRFYAQQLMAGLKLGSHQLASVENQSQTEGICVAKNWIFYQSLAIFD
jgi:hypothetical protein